MTTTARPRRAARRHSDLEKLVIAALEEMKAVDVRLLDVRSQTDVADAMIVASGNSDRHVRAIAQNVVDKAREARRRPMGVEGTRDAEWVLVDLQDVIVHVMLPRVREFYAIEQLWEPAMANPAAARSSEAGERAGDEKAPHGPKSRTRTVSRAGARRTSRTTPASAASPGSPARARSPRTRAPS